MLQNKFLRLEGKLVKQLIMLLILFIPGTALSAQFDIWETGISLSQIVETARQHNIPLRQEGIIAQDNGFNQRFINDRFWKADRVGYTTTLMGVGAKVILKIHPDWPRRMYEIEIRFVGESSSQEFKTELLNMLTEKHGKPDKTLINFHRAYRWEPSESDQILLTMYSYPILSYSDVKLKKHALKQMGYKIQNQKHGYTKKDSSKF
ncbi:MAG: hypothetical protein DRI32_08260 [Chloroflexi bacterium]|nr:MAG: hypothetical protein DRI32_08260 [Chloroflexota bacterium]